RVGGERPRAVGVAPRSREESPREDREAAAEAVVQAQDRLVLVEATGGLDLIHVPRRRAQRPHSVGRRGVDVAGTKLPPAPRREERRRQPEVARKLALHPERRLEAVLRVEGG